MSTTREQASRDPQIKLIATLQGPKFTIDPMLFIESLSAEKLTEILNAIAQNKNITKLIIHCKSLTTSHFEQIRLLTNIKKITFHDDFQSQQLTSEALTALSKSFPKSSSLKSLEIHSTHMTDTDCETLKQYEGLEQIAVYANKVTEDGLQQLFEHPNLNTIKISSSSITDETLKKAKFSLAADKKLTLHLVSDISADGFKAVIEGIPNLYGLMITSNKITNEMVAHLSNNPYLHFLDLRGKQIKLKGQQYFGYLQPAPKPNKEFFIEHLLKLPDPTFIDKIATSNEITSLVLEQPSLVAKLNALQYDANGKKLTPEEQIFSKSCVARSIMIFLNKFGYITDEGVNNKRELEIYKAIWSNPGEVADLKLVQQYLNRFNINMVVLEDCNHINQLANTSKTYKDYNTLYQRERSHLNVKNLDLSQFSKNENFILIVINQYGLHGIVCTFEKGRYYTFDPGDGKRSSARSLSDIFKYNKDLKFSGVILKINPSPNHILKAGIFRKKDIKPKNPPQNPKNNRLVQ